MDKNKHPRWIDSTNRAAVIRAIGEITVELLKQRREHDAYQTCWCAETAGRALKAGLLAYEEDEE